MGVNAKGWVAVYERETVRTRRYAALARKVYLPGRCVCGNRVALVRRTGMWEWLDPDTALPCTHEDAP